MDEICISRMSSKGQIVIPSKMRANLKEGDKFIVIRDNERIILKKMEAFEKNLEEDLEFARRTEEAWKSYERGEFKEMNFNDFIAEMKKW